MISSLVMSDSNQAPVRVSIRVSMRPEQWKVSGHHSQRHPVTMPRHAGIKTRIGNHTFRATGIIADLQEQRQARNRAAHRQP
jgi:hypothetical protein